MILDKWALLWPEWWKMFAHVLLLITVIAAMAALVWQNLPYKSLMTDNVRYTYDYIIGKLTVKLYYWVSPNKSLPIRRVPFVSGVKLIKAF